MAFETKLLRLLEQLARAVERVGDKLRVPTSQEVRLSAPIPENQTDEGEPTMPMQPQTMLSNEKIRGSVTPKDQGGEEYDALPPGWNVSVTAVDVVGTGVVGVTQDPDDPRKFTLSSDNVGESDVTVATTDQNGNNLSDSPETVRITVAHAAPGGQNATLSASEPE